MSFKDMHVLDEDGNIALDKHGYKRGVVGNHALTAHNMEILCQLENRFKQQIFETEVVLKVREELSKIRRRTASPFDKLVA